MEAKELRLGNLLKRGDEIVCVSAIFKSHFNCSNQNGIDYGNNHQNNYQPVLLTEEILLKCPNHKRVNGKNILNTIYFEIGRNRVISVGNIGTGNEAIWLCEIDPNVENRITDLVCIHNFDYDGKIMLHKFQNIFHLLTNEELTVNL